jgi:hypothetical protein
MQFLSQWIDSVFHDWTPTAGNSRTAFEQENRKKGNQEVWPITRVRLLSPRSWPLVA